MILDTGPLVALLNKGDAHHQWATQVWQTLTTPLLTCDAVVVETLFLLRHQQRTAEVFAFLDSGAIELSFLLQTEYSAVCDLMTCYVNVPMSITDACLVRMAEIHPNRAILTLDNDFKIYRKNRNQPLHIVMP